MLILSRKHFGATQPWEPLQLISRMTSKSYSLDPMPIWILKLCLDELLPVITCIINYSLRTGVFPDLRQIYQASRSHMSFP